MKTISAEKIKHIVSDLCIEANLILRKDVLSALKQVYRAETSRRAKEILNAVVRNAAIAKKERLAICQDTGLPCVFIELGEDLKIEGDLKKAINQGVESGYKRAYLRNSIVQDPLSRVKLGYCPAIIHIDIVKGDKLKITVLPKGFGCENKTRLNMFKPTATPAEIKKFIIETVKTAGPDACPPYVVGVGIGGTADYACFLAKKALLRKIRHKGLSPTRPERSRRKGTVLELERELLSEINHLNIGPMGLGGRTTALAVNIETYPTHIAGLPVCVNISCHALRSATRIL